MRRGGRSGELSQEKISTHISSAKKLAGDVLKLARRGGEGSSQRAYELAIKLHREVCVALNVFEGRGLDEDHDTWTAFEESDLGVGDEKADMIRGSRGYVGTFLNSRYQVQVREYEGGFGPCTWLSIVRRDRRAVHDWRDMQRIKNELCGAEYEAIEIYPAESRLVDTNNQYHLFVFSPDHTFPLGYRERDVGDDVFGTAHQQRPFDVVPDDLNARGGCSARINAEKTIEVFGPPVADAASD